MIIYVDIIDKTDNEDLEPEKVDQEYHIMVSKPTEGLRKTLKK